MSTVTPFALNVDLLSGQLGPATTVIERRLSQMQGMYVDADAEQYLREEDDPVIYEVFQYDVPERIGELFVCTTVLRPGQVGQEYYMTKGHYHEVRDRGEVYYGLMGEGYVLMQTEDASGPSTALELRPGVVVYVPPGYGHRSINTGEEPMVFLAVYPGDAGHDYGAIEEEGFRKAMVMRSGKPTLVDRMGLMP